MPAIDDQNPWILIDFILNATITAIATQGLAGSNMSFVANYTLDFGYDGINFEDYKYNGSTKVRMLFLAFNVLRQVYVNVCSMVVTPANRLRVKQYV